MILVTANSLAALSDFIMIRQGGAGKKGKKKKGNEPPPDSSQVPEDNVPAGRIALLDAGLGGHNSSAAYV